MLLTERVLSQIQQANMGFLCGVHGVTLRDKARSFDIITFVITSSTLLAPSWCGQQNYQVAVDREVLRVVLRLLPPTTFPRGKMDMKINE